MDVENSFRKTQENSMESINKLFDVAQTGGAFGAPQVVEGRTVIQMAEVMVGMGVGFGVGEGSSPVVQVEGADGKTQGGEGSGGGGGGGGYSQARPVAVLIAGPEGVRVEPVIDTTKIALAMFTTLGAMAFMLSRMIGGSRGKCNCK
jgi:uncharacterized spore protein YtfJ